MHRIAGNTNTLAGNVPPKADLGDLRGLASGIDGRIAPMINGGDFDGAKAYKDSKVGSSYFPLLFCSSACKSRVITSAIGQCSMCQHGGIVTLFSPVVGTRDDLRPAGVKVQSAV